jgi:hypothetical protein
VAEYTRTEETTSRIVYTLRTPTNWVEVSKVLLACQQDLSAGTRYDDLVTVDVGDDEIRFSFDASLVSS